MNRNDSMDFFEGIPSGDTPQGGAATPAAEVVEPETPPAQPSEPKAPENGGDPKPDQKSVPDDDTSVDKAEDSKPVPGHRLRELTEARRKAEAEAEELRAKLAAIENGKPADPAPKADPDEGDDDDEDFTPETKRALEKTLKGMGILTQADLEERERVVAVQSQIKKDVAELQGWATEQGYPEFKPEEVTKFANENLGGQITSKAGFKAAYLALHEDTIAESLKKVGVDAASQPQATGERPGTTAGAQVPEEPKSMKEKILSTMAKNRST